MLLRRDSGNWAVFSCSEGKPPHYRHHHTLRSPMWIWEWKDIAYQQRLHAPFLSALFHPGCGACFMTFFYGHVLMTTTMPFFFFFFIMAHKRPYNARMTLPEVHEKRWPITGTSAPRHINLAMTTHCSDSALPLKNDEDFSVIGRFLQFAKR